MRKFRNGFVDFSCPYIDEVDLRLEEISLMAEKNFSLDILLEKIEDIKFAMENIREINHSLRNLAEDYELEICDLEDDKSRLELDLDEALYDLNYYKQLEA